MEQRRKDQEEKFRHVQEHLEHVNDGLDEIKMRTDANLEEAAVRKREVRKQREEFLKEYQEKERERLIGASARRQKKDKKRELKAEALNERQLAKAEYIAEVQQAKAIQLQLQSELEEQRRLNYEDNQKRLQRTKTFQHALKRALLEEEEARDRQRNQHRSKMVLRLQVARQRVSEDKEHLVDRVAHIRKMSMAGGSMSAEALVENELSSRARSSPNTRSPVVRRPMTSHAPPQRAETGASHRERLAQRLLPRYWIDCAHRPRSSPCVTICLFVVYVVCRVQSHVYWGDFGERSDVAVVHGTLLLFLLSLCVSLKSSVILHDVRRCCIWP